MTDPPAPGSSPANGYQRFRQAFLTPDTDPFTANGGKEQHRWQNIPSSPIHWRH